VGSYIRKIHLHKPLEGRGRNKIAGVKPKTRFGQPEESCLKEKRVPQINREGKAEKKKRGLNGITGAGKIDT